MIMVQYSVFELRNDGQMQVLPTQILYLKQKKGSRLCALYCRKRNLSQHPKTNTKVKMEIFINIIAVCIRVMLQWVFHHTYGKTLFRCRQLTVINHKCHLNILHRRNKENCGNGLTSRMRQQQQHINFPVANLLATVGKKSYICATVM